MRAQLESELIKLYTTRGVYGPWAAAWALVALATWSTIAQAGADNLSGELADQPFFFINAVNLSVIAGVIGARSATDEFRYGTVVAAVLSTRHRFHLVAAKATVAALAGAVLGVTSQALMAGLVVLLTTAGPGLTPSGADITAMAGVVVAAGFWGLLGTAVGLTVRHQVAALVGIVVWVLVIESLGAALIGTAGRYLPGQAACSLTGGPDLLPVSTAAPLLVLYGTALLTIADLSTIRRDL